MESRRRLELLGGYMRLVEMLVFNAGLIVVARNVS
jgi:hypothetical protein